MGRVAAIVVDLVLVVVFALLGRMSHAESLDVEGVMRTALPFLAGTLMAWITFALKGKTGLTLLDGLIVWAMTVVLGLFFRVMLGDTAAVAFILVAALTLAAFLLGWRAVRALVLRGRPRPDAPARERDPRRSGNPARRNAGD